MINSTTTAIVYEDGVPVITNTSATGPLNSASSNLYIGSSGTSTNFIEGNIDEVAIFNYALDSNQVDEIYNATSSGKTADLSTMATPPVAWYRNGRLKKLYGNTVDITNMANA